MNDPRNSAGSGQPLPRIFPLWRVGAAFLAAAGVADALFNFGMLRMLDRSPGLWFVVTATVPSWVILAALLPAVFVVAERYPLHDRSALRNALVHLPASLVFAGTHLVLAVVVSDVLLSRRAAEVGFPRALGSGFGNYLVFDVLVYAGMVGSYYAIDYQRRYREQTHAAARLQVQLARAQLEALRSQLDPHFLFNALNAISGTALRRDPERTAGLISDLSRLLRRSLRQPAAEVTLGEELDFLEAYLSIERARMGGRLHVDVDVPAELLDHPVPSLLLQPLAENAIRHGLAEKAGGGRLEIRVRAREDRIVLEVQDDGCGLAVPRADGSAVAEGVGLGNTRARLAELYGDRGSVTLSNRDGGGARVVVEIPSPGRPRRANGIDGRVVWRAS